MSFVTEIKTFAALGSGVIGSGWIARALAHGLDVVAWDPAPGAEAALRARVANAWPALRKQGLAPGAAQERLRFVASIEECVGDADFIQESAPERLDLKLDLHARISAAARPDVLIGSSTSGLLPSEFYAEASHPERCLVGHPFNPVYLLPLVEVVGGERTAAEAVRAAMRVYESLGMRPLHVRKEVPGFIADRLLEALWREALHLVNDGVATTGEIDDAIRFGAGLRWSFMGTFLTLHPGRWQRRHAPLHGAVRPGAAIALDLPAGAGTHRSPDRPGGGGHRRAAGRAQHRRARALPRRLPAGGARGDQGNQGPARLRLRRVT